MHRCKIIPMNLIEQLTARQGQQSAVPIAYNDTAENQHFTVRDVFNERELRMLKKLDETGNTYGKSTSNLENSS
jgi:hypothetical protein